MWYEINVSRDGKHYFATHKRSIDTIKQATEIRDRLRQAMTKEEGFEITVTQYQQTSVELAN